MARCDIQCGPECAWIFDRVRVLPRQAGGTLVEWALHPEFTDPPPYTFTLQWNEYAGLTEEGWLDLGSPVVDTFQLTDVEPRSFGQLSRSHYRVVVSTALGSYASQPVLAVGDLDQRYWQQAKGIIRQETERLKRTIAGTRGFLLKRRWQGQRCECMDPLVNESRRPHCELCYGTGITGGYYPPQGCVYVERRNYDYRSHAKQADPGNEHLAFGGRMLNVPQIFSGDVWVDKAKDERFFVHKFAVAAAVKGVALVLDPVDLRQAPFSHVIYKFPLPTLQDV